MTNSEKLSFVATVFGLILTGVGLILNWWENRRSHRLTFFADYTNRYQKIMIDLPFQAFKLDFDISKLTEMEKKELLKQLISYYLLCSEEYDLYNEGFIKKRIWKIWAEGITENLKKPAFSWGWEQVKEEFAFFQDFSDWMHDQYLMGKKKEVSSPTSK